MYNSGDNLDADIIVVSARSWSCTADALFDHLWHSLVTHVEVNPGHDGIMYMCGKSYVFYGTVAVGEYLLIMKILV